MNKIFKVVWSKVRNCYVVVSEIAKNTVSGVGKRNRVNRLSLGATLAAAVLTSGFFLPNEGFAEDISVAEEINYIAIKAVIPNWSNNNQGNLTQAQVDLYNEYKLQGSSQKVYRATSGGSSNINTTYYLVSANNEWYWVQEGYTIKTTGTTPVLTADAGTTVLVSNIVGEALNPNFKPISTIQVHEDSTTVKTVVNDNLDKVTLNPYGSASNSRTVTVQNNHTYVLNRGTREMVVVRTDGGQYKNPVTNQTVNSIDFDEAFVSVSTSSQPTKLTYDEISKSYYYDGHHVHNNSVYYIGDKNAKNYRAGVFVINDKVYDGTVYGNNGETLLTGQVRNDDNTTSLITYWGAAIENYNMTIADSGMTLGNLREGFEILKRNDDELADADIKSISIAETTQGGSISLNYKKTGEMVNGTINIVGGGGKVEVVGNAQTHPDTYVTISNVVDGTTHTIRLETGSKILPNPEYASGDPELNSISINGKVFRITNTGGSVGSTNLQITEIGELSSIDNKHHGWQIEDNNVHNGMDFVDTTLAPNYSGLQEDNDSTTNTYVIGDTAGNSIEIKDVASADYVNSQFTSVNQNLTELNSKSIKRIKLDPNDKSLSILREGENGSDGDPIDGTVKFYSYGGQKVGDEYVDTYIVLVNDEGDGTPDNKVVLGLPAGSKVVANDGGDGTILNKLSVNGQEFTVVGTDYRLIPGNDTIINGKTGYVVGTDGTVDLKVKNGDDATSVQTVTVGNIATKSALDAIVNKVDAGWNLKVGDETGSYNVKSEDGKDTVTLKSNDENANLTISRNDGVIAFDFSGTPSFTSVNVGSNVTINGDGIVIDNAGNDLAFSKTNVNVGGNQIHNVAEGTNLTDAVNLGQLQSYVKQNELNTYTEDITVVSGSNSATVNFIRNDGDGYHLNVVGGSNVNVAADDSNKTVTISATDTRYKVVPSNSNQNTNVVNTYTFSDHNGNNSVEIVDTDTNKYISSGSASYIDANGFVDLMYNDGTTVTNAITGLHDYYATGLAVDNGTKQLVLTLNNGGTHTVELSALGTMNSWKAKVGNNDEISIADGNTLAYEAGDNIVLSSNVNSKTINVATASDVTFDSVTVNGSVNGKSIVINSNGIDAGGYGITSVANGNVSKDSTDAVNGGQLWNNTIDGFKFSGQSTLYDTIDLVRNDGSKVSGSLKITSGGGKDAGHPDTFITIENDTGSIKLNTGSKVIAIKDVDDNIVDDEQAGITVNGDFHWGGYIEGIAINGKAYSFGVASSAINHDYHLVMAEYEDETSTPNSVNLSNHFGQTYGDNANAYKADENGVVTLNILNDHDENVTDKKYRYVYLADVASKTQQDTNTAQLKGTVMYDENQNGTYNYHSIKLGETGSNINGIATTEYQKNTDGTYTGGVEVTNVAYAVNNIRGEADYDGSAAVNVDLLNDKISAVQTIAEKQTTLSDGKNINVEPTTSNGVTNYTVNLEDNITLGDANNTNVNINGNAGSITAITKDGNNTTGQISIDSANNRITVGVGGTNNQVVIDGGSGTVTGLTNTTWSGDVEDVVANRAATEGQLQQAITTINNNVTAAKTVVEKGDNINVDSTVASDGHTVYKISGTDTIKTGNVEVANDGSITLQHVGLNDVVNGVTTKIIGLHDYAIEEQSKAVDNGTVKLSVSDKYGNGKPYDVVITDVASASKLTEVEGKVSTNTQTIQEHTTKIESNTTKIDKEIIDRQIADNQILQQVQGNDRYLDSRINQVNSRVNKVGAGAAALAALHPMDFDPDDKLSFAVGAGNYAGENATAIGAFYRPNEKVMMSVGGTYGNGENMVNMGLSFALDKTNNVSNSRTAMAREIVDLREQVATQGQQIAQLVALVQQLAGVQQPVVPQDQLFPDIPENHWAYEYVHGLAAKGNIEGYPDGNFGGDRTMTRYEFAAMLFRALEKGVVLSEQIRKEFEPELGRIRVDRVKGADADLNKIERVRVNTAVDRDDYGSKVVQVKH